MINGWKDSKYTESKIAEIDYNSMIASAEVIEKEINKNTHSELEHNRISRNVDHIKIVMGWDSIINSNYNLSQLEIIITNAENYINGVN